MALIDPTVRTNSARIHRLEEVVGDLRTHLESQTASNHLIAEEMRALGDRFAKAMADQEARWTAAHKQLTESAIDMMQEAMLQAFARKLLDWLWTLAFSSGLVALGWIATRVLVVH